MSHQAKKKPTCCREALEQSPRGRRLKPKEQKGMMWSPSKPREYTPEEQRTRAHAMLDLAHRVAKAVRDGAVAPAKDALRIAINKAVKDDDRLRQLGVSPADTHRILNATLSLISGR